MLARRWQRYLLTTLEEWNAAFLADLLPRPFPRSDYVALHRAAWTLGRQGKIEIYYPMRVCGCGVAGGVNSRWVARQGYNCTLGEVPRLRARIVDKRIVDTGYLVTRINIPLERHQPNNHGQLTESEPDDEVTRLVEEYFPRQFRPRRPRTISYRFTATGFHRSVKEYLRNKSRGDE
jgi:hypothetical protein